jgi:hypothetical protein
MIFFLRLNLLFFSVIMYSNLHFCLLFTAPGSDLTVFCVLHTFYRISAASPVVRTVDSYYYGSNYVTMKVARASCMGQSSICIFFCIDLLFAV